MVKHDVLMSIKPEYAEAILSGSKHFELRRRRPSFAPGTRIVVYSSSPDRKLLGTFEAGEVRSAAPNDLWPLVEDGAGIDRATFQSYYSGCAQAHAIEVRNPRRRSPRPLRFRPPQSYLFLKPATRPHRSILRWASS
jgi:predicted transcriptional regulator